MSILTAVFLGVLQGLTEFLPVSSSGHLVIAQSMIPNFGQTGILFDVIVHFGTFFSILVFFRKSLVLLFKKYFVMVIVGTIPAVLVGFYFRNIIEGLFESVRVAGIALLATAGMNYLTHKGLIKKIRDMNLKAFGIGIFQAIAIVPGVSRSGSTIFAGTLLGLKKKDAAEFSFILSLPVVLGANILEIENLKGEEIFIWLLVAGFLSAAVSGYFAMRIVFEFLKGGEYKYFSVYCAVLGLAVLLLG